MAKIFPVLRKTKAAKNPNNEVYVNWKNERITAGRVGVCGWVSLNS